MPKITFVDSDGVTHIVQAEIGSTVMETAMRNDIAGIIASCGGSCACATCHVHIDEEWMAVVGGRSGEEEDMLDSAIDVGPTSRLSCQIKVVEELDGLKVTIAARQI
jgi:2Fe-2S ferredoxin